MYSLPLTNGPGWYLEACDPAASSALDGLSATMRLPGVRTTDGRRDAARTVHVYSKPPSAQPAGITCILPQTKNPGEIPFVHYTAISAALARGLLQDGGVLLHGALTEFQSHSLPGKGAILSAAGGTGKSTASRRLPLPWKALSDDAVLVVPGGADGYRAHPWPTWSSFLFDDRPGGIWNVPAAVPLRACFFMSQALQDSIEPLGMGQTVSLLTESARQINFLDSALALEVRRKIRLQRFDAICAMARAVPAHLLRISLTGEFWKEMESVVR